MVQGYVYIITRDYITSPLKLSEFLSPSRLKTKDLRVQTLCLSLLLLRTSLKFSIKFNLFLNFKDSHDYTYLILDSPDRKQSRIKFLLSDLV